MDANFWQQRWEKNETAFHQSEANPLLVKHFENLSLVKGSRIFLPLCGKTLDIPWLLSQGYRVAGAELSELAVAQLFTKLGVTPKVSEVGQAYHYSATNIDIFVGDIFNLSEYTLGPVDATYDRAALVALPKEMRDRYTLHIREITHQAPQLLICFEYDQSSMEGPPFSVNDEEVRKQYGDHYNITLVASTEVSGGLKGKYAAEEHVWLLQNNE